MINDLPTYDEARKAIRGGNDPKAFLHLGIIYANGIGAPQNHVLANYFYEKALSLGCSEAEDYIGQEYYQGARDIVKEAEYAVQYRDSISPDTMDKLRKQLDKERIKKNYGHLSKLREYLPLFFPDYNPGRGKKDIVEGRDTMDADIYYASSSYHIRNEVNMDVLDRLFSQLFSPITNDKALYQRIIERNSTGVLMEDEREFLQPVFNISSTYEKVCRNYGIEHNEILEIEITDIYPYIKPSTVALLMKRAFRCLLSIRKTEPKISQEFLNHLDEDEALLNISEQVEDKDLQLFLISYVELSIDLEALEIYYQSLRNSYLNNDLAVFASYLNAFTERLGSVGIKHHLPVFTPDNLPEIKL